MKIAQHLPSCFLLLVGIGLSFFSPSVSAQDLVVSNEGLKIPLELKPEQLVPGSKISLKIHNSTAMPVACTGAGNQPVGGFTQCANQSNATVKTDRNDWWNCCAPPLWQASEAYEYNFPSIQTIYPCVAGATVDQLILTITINSVTFNLGSPYACCEDYLEGLYGNLYDNCPPGVDCPVAGDGIVNNGNPGTGDCTPNGDHLNYNGTTFPLGIPYTATTTCMAGLISTSDAFGVDIVPSFSYQDASANGCNCPTNLISQGLISVDYSIQVEYVFCSNSLPSGCYPSTFTPVGPLCETDPAVTLPTTSNNGITGTWNPASINPAGQGGNTVTAIFTPNPGQCVGGTSQMAVTVNAATAPNFAQIGPLCETSSPVPLPATSPNGISGTWNVGTSFNPSGQGGNTVPITFTPNPGQCASPQTINVVVNAATVPNFAQIGPLCESGSPVPLPGTSPNGVAGTWNVGTSFNPSGQGGNTIPITFTPNPGQCASVQTMNIVVNAQVAPAFTQIGPLCESGPAVPLPGSSNNGVAGTWNVGTSFNPSGQGGNTVTITFTPNPGQCASVQTMNIVVNSAVLPAFNPIGPVCESAAPIPLPGTSTNGVSGTWNVGPNFNPAGQGGTTATITFTPNAGQCATSTTLNITVQQQVVPVFAPIGPLCESEPPVTLPGNSLNGIFGNWNTGPTFNPAGQGGNTVSINFTPSPGQCATTTSIDISVTQAIQPVFSPIGPLCESGPPVPLPTSSTNGITGTWNAGANFNPAGQGGNTVTISFTPDPGQCAFAATMDIVVNLTAVPVFSPIGPLCENGPAVPLPGTSLNSISGAWNVGTSFNPAGLGGTTTNIIFTPNAGQCASNETVPVTVNSIPQNTNLNVACNASMMDYFVDFQTNGNMVSSTAGTVVNNGGGNFTVDNIPEGTNVTVTVTNTTTGCTSTFDVTSPSCSCPPITAPAGNNVVICENETIPALTVTVGPGLQVDWYNAATGGTLLLANSNSYTPPGAGTFFAEAVDPVTNCKSTVRESIMLSILPVDTTFVQETSCNPMEVGVDTTVFNTATCDSVVITTTTLIPGDEVFQNATSCDPADVGVDTLFLINQIGCDSLVITNTTLSPADTTFAAATTCNPALVGVDTTVFATAICDSVVITTTTLLPPVITFLTDTSCNPAEVGLDTLVLSNQAGCDSLVITQTTLVPLPPVFTQATTCDPNLVGVDTLIFQTAINCDSVVITTTTLLPGVEAFQNATSCDPAQVGVDTLVFTGQNGCDSLVILTTMLSDADTTFVPATTCDVTQVGVDTTVFATATCDSVVITTTTLLPGDVTFLQATSCDLTAVGLDTLVLSNQAGCDSLVITTTTFDGIDPTFTQATSCDPAQVGVDTTIFSVAGCDSMVITTTTLLPGDVVFLNANSCDPNQVGVDTMFFSNTAGCDSLVITTTSLSAADTTFVAATTCDPGQVGVDTTVFSTPLCDSVVITTTVLLQSDETFLNQITCDPAAAGVDTLFFINQNGCDSIVITTTVLEIIPPTFLQATTCSISEVGVDSVIFATTTCDSLVITTTTLLPGSEVTIELTTCVQSEVGIDTVVLVNQVGCDSLVITNTVLAGGITSAEISAADPSCKEPFGSISIQNVEGGEAPYQYSIDGGQLFSNNPDFGQLAAGNYEIVIEDANGCVFETSEQLAAGNELQIVIDPDQVNLDLGDSYFINPVLNVPASSLDLVQWLPGNFLDCVDCLSATSTPLESTTYTVTVTDKDGCEASATITFIVNEKVKVYMPNVFSPNGDGINDVFTVLGDEKLIVRVDELLIFDRWGDSVFENFNFPVNDFSNGWDGTLKGKKMHQGVYVYLAFVTLSNGRKVMLEGEITLIK